MKHSRKINGLNGTLNKDVPFTHEQLHNALMDVEDALDRALVPFILLEGAAKQIYEGAGSLELNEISVGVLERHMTQSGRSLFRMVRPKAEFTYENITYNSNGVPIIIWIIHKNYKFFQNPDSRIYCLSEFKLPNPFMAYWRARFLIK